MAGELKQPDILTRKPNLKLCGNHYKSEQRIKRIWTGYTAYRDGKGWYKHTKGEK